MTKQSALEIALPTAMADFGGSSYTLNESGTTARVAIVDDAPHPYVVKVMREEFHFPAATYRLGEETAILSFLVGAGQPLRVPFPMDYEREEPPYCVFSKIPGHYSYEEIAALRPEQRVAAGQRLGRLIAWQQQALPLDVFMAEVRSDSPHPQGYKWSYDQSFKQQVAGFQRPEYPTLCELARRSWADLHYYYPLGCDGVGDRLNHSAIVPENLLWEDGELTGIIDWNDAQVGDVNQELRGPFLLGPDVFEAAISELEDHHVRTDLKHILAWASMRNVVILCSRINENDVHNQHFVQAAQRLQYLHPDEDWSELHVPLGSKIV